MVRVFSDEAAAKAAAAEATTKLEKTGEREPIPYKTYRYKVGENVKPGTEIWVIERQPSSAAQIALGELGIESDTVEAPKVLAPEAYVNLLTPEQLNAVQKLLTERKKKLANG